MSPARPATTLSFSATLGGYYAYFRSNLRFFQAHFEPAQAQPLVTAGISLEEGIAHGTINFEI